MEGHDPNVPEMHLYEVAQVAQRLGVTPQMIYKLITQGKLGATAIGRHYRITDQDIEAYLEAGRRKVRERAARRALDK